MYPVVKNQSGVPLAILNNITSNSLKRKINSDYTFDFKCFYEPLKTDYIKFDNVIVVDGQTFDINYIDESHSIGVEYDVKCEHVFYRLIGEPLENYANTGTPAAILTHLLTGTEFSVGVVDYTAPIIFAVNRNTNKMNIILALVNSLGGEIGFSNGGFTINIKQTLGEDNGYQIRIRKNLQAINKIIDRRGTNKATYKISMIDIFKSDEMIMNGFENLEALNLGDKVQIIDETINVDVELFIVEEEKDAIKAERVNVVLGDSFDYLSDKISFIETQAIKQTDVIFGVKLNNNVGLEINSGDQEGRAQFNANKIAMQSYVDGEWVDDFYFDRIKKKYVFNGELSANLISALEAEFDVTISNTVIVNQLSAQKGNIAELTVDQLDTSDKVQKYLASDTTNVNYIRVDNQVMEYVSAVKSTGESQITDRHGNLIYWLDVTHEGTTLDVTDFPVMIYNYNEFVKMIYEFKDLDGVITPVITLGVGNGTGDQMKGKIFKDADGLVLEYLTNENKLYQLIIGEDGIVQKGQEELSSLDFYANGFSAAYGGQTVGYRWTKDGLGRITQLTSIESSEVVPVHWNGGDI